MVVLTIFKMRYERIYVDLEKLKSIIKARGLRERDFCVLTWGEETHRTIKEFVRRPNITIETAMKICNTLDISLDELFSGSDKIGESPYIIGNQNIVNSAVFNQDQLSLMAENKALKMLIKEKDERINDLKKVNGQLETMVDLLKQKGQNSDSKTSDS
jgi:transcriptional regulator with XRE-family HTH domain